MVQLKYTDVRKRVEELDKLVVEYKASTPEKERDYAAYEQSFERRLKKVVENLDALIHECVRGLSCFSKHKDRHALPLEKRVRLLLVKELSEKGNRKIANLLGLFSAFQGIDVCYKTVERLYSDNATELALFNLLMLLLNKRGVKVIDACGDATGYSLTISKHYSSYAQKLKQKSKEQQVTPKAFIYHFAIMDLESKMYVCFGSSLKSEKEAFDKAMQMLKETEVQMKSIRLDRYYSYPTYVNQFKESMVYIIPKRDVGLMNGFKWTQTMRAFTFDTMNYLREYFKRSNSESGFASDKKLFGWKISQKREDRMDTALFVRTIWRNLLWLYG